MYRFPPGEGFSKMLTEAGPVSISTVGYNDFLYLAPQRQPWLQSCYTLHFVLRGSGFLEMGGKRHAIGARQIFVIPPNELMMYHPNEADKWAYVWFCVSGKGAADLFKNIGAGIEHPVLQTDYGTHLTTLLSEIFVNRQFEDDYRIISAFYEIVHCVTKPHSPDQSQIKHMIDCNFHLQDFTMEKLCRDCGLSHAQLCRNFLKAYGMQPKQYLIQCRMDYAKRLLQKTDLKLDAIARSCGYNDSVHFMKEFKRRAGVSAGRYRKAARSGLPGQFDEKTKNS